MCVCVCSLEFHPNKKPENHFADNKKINLFIKIKSEKETYHIPHPPILMEAATTAQIQKQKQKVTISLYED